MNGPELQAVGGKIVHDTGITLELFDAGKPANGGMTGDPKYRTLAGRVESKMPCWLQGAGTGDAVAWLAVTGIRRVSGAAEGADSTGGLPGWHGSHLPAACAAGVAWRLASRLPGSNG